MSTTTSTTTSMPPSSTGKPAGVTKRIGMVIGLKEECEKKYREVHADSFEGVRDLLSKYHMKNFTIWLQRMPDGKLYEFATFDYTGNDYEGDMAALGKEERNIEWLKQCDPMQIPLHGSTSWTHMEQVYFNP